MADITKTVGIIFKGDDQTSATLAKVESGLKDIGTAGGTAAKGTNEAADAAEKLGSKSDKVQIMTDAMKALATAAVAKAFIDANVAAEKFEKVMTAVTGSTQEAAKEFEYIKGVSDRLGMDVLQAADAYSKFAAATKGSALEGANAKVVFEGFVGAIATLGGSSFDASGALVQLSQGISKGKFELEDLKSIAERVPGFFKLFADSLGVTTEELFSMISVGEIGAEQILKVGKALQDTYGGDKLKGYSAELERLRNTINLAFIDLGDTGLFDALTKGIQIATASVAGAVVAFDTLGKVIGTVAGAIASGSFTGLGDELDRILQSGADKVRGARDAMLGLDDATKKTSSSAKDAGESISEGMKAGAGSTKAVEEQTKALNKSLKEVGLDPKKFQKSAEEIIKAFETIASSPAATGQQIAAAYVASLQSIKGNEALGSLNVALSKAFEGGKISADQFNAALDALDMRQRGLLPAAEKGAAATTKVADATKKAAEEAEKAEKATAAYKLELEKLASNERIKLIEAKVAINVAEAEAQAKMVVAAFESIGTAVTSTGQVLQSVFGVFKDIGSEFDPRFKIIENQIEIENKLRKDALDLQKQLTLAQIDSLRAKTKSLQNGDALIKIDGAGLKPHLEAFMWEILKAIQTRVNKDGLALLLGTT